MKFLASIFLVTLSLASAGQIDFTKLDGIISESENSQLSKLGENGSSKISAAVVGDYIKVNILSDAMYVASLCFCSDDSKTLVVHASAALGQVSYSARGDSWRSDETFDWKVRETDMSKKTIEKRRDYLDTYGWVANTLSMGRRGEVEFVIKKSLFSGNEVFLAAGLMPESNPEEIVPLPTETSGDCAAYSLVAGDPQKSYRFEPKTWFKISL